MRAEVGSAEWHANPAYGSADLLAIGPPEAVSALPPDTVVEQAVELLMSLPFDRRLDALAEVQCQLLAEQVQEEVRRITSGRTRRSRS